MELRVKEVQLPEVISFNYEELKQEIAAKAAQYKTLVYTEDQIKLAKTDRANLNKLKKALNDERIRREKEYMQPFNDFKNKINELIDIIASPILLIDSQVKGYEEQKKLEKKDEILHYFEGCAFPEWVDFEKIFDVRWLNLSVKMAAVEAEINARLEQINTDLHTLSELPEFAFEAAEVYKNTLDMNKAISEGHRLAEIAKRKAEHEAALKAQEEARARAEAEAQAKAQSEPLAPNTDLNTIESGGVYKAPEAENAPKSVERMWISFKANLTTADALALKEFFVSRNIEFKAI